MTPAATKADELTFLLQEIVKDLQIPPSTDEAVRQHYRAIGSHLADAPEVEECSPSLFTQGSYRLGTTVRPVRRDEFDLDFVVELAQISPAETSRDVYGRVLSALQSSGVYRSRLTKLPRCIRVNYASSFHIDVVPAIPDANSATGGILIPTHSGAEWGWASTDPRGYIRWFESQSVEPRMRNRMMEAKIEPLPSNDSKTSLQLGVQLIKRYQDKHVADDELRTPSILVTTVAARAFDGSAPLLRTVDKIVSTLVSLANQSPAPIVPNPTIATENIARKWGENPDVYRAFGAWTEELRTDWALLLSDLLGVDRIRDHLAKMFGDQPTEAAVRAYAAMQRARAGTNELRTSRRTGVLGGSAAAAGAMIKNRGHTFYGDEEV